MVILVEVAEDLLWITANLQRIKGAPMWWPSQVAVVLTNTAQTMGWGTFLGGHSYSKHAQLIHLLELHAMLHGLALFVPLLRGQEVECQMDNTTMLVYLVNGSRSNQEMTTIMKDIYNLLGSISTSLYKAVWVWGSLNVEANAASRWVDLDDWVMRLAHLLWMHQALGPWTIDRFTDHINWQAAWFNSLFLVPGTEAQDVFSVSWVGEVNLLVLPFYMILRVLQHLVESWVVGLLVAPRWEAQPWWPILLRLSMRVVHLGLGAEVVMPGPLGQCELVRGRWTMEVHMVDGTWFAKWRQ